MHALELCRADRHIALDSAWIMARLSPAAPARLIYQRHDDAGQFGRIKAVERTIVNRLGEHQIELTVQVTQ